MSKKLPKVVMIHGNGGGNGEGGWFPWVKRQLVHHGFQVLNPSMPDPVEAKASIWLPYMEKELAIDHDTIIIGHSSGAVAALRYAETHSIVGSILVAPCYTDLGEPTETIGEWYDKLWQWQAICDNQQWIIQFASQDDPFIPIHEARHIHEKINAEYHEYLDREHFGWPTEIKELPEVVEGVLRKTR